MSDPVLDVERELIVPPTRSPRALDLLGRHDFRDLFAAVAASELGDSLHYIALMWFALDRGGPLGVVAVRLADSVPALLFGFHGGLAADRFSRRRLMVGADLARAAILVPVAVAGLAGSLPLWGLVVAAFLLQTATSYFEPAYGAILPTLVDRPNVQRANALVQATVQAVSIGGWAVAAAFLAFMPISVFFAVNAASFAVSAAFISRVRGGGERAAHAEPPRLREGIAALRPRPLLAIAVAALAVAVTISAGAWIGGMPTFVQRTLGRGAGGFSLVMVAYAAGSIASGVALARMPIRRKGRASLLAWLAYLPAYGLIALAHSLGVLLVGALCSGIGESAATVLLTSAVQEEVPDRLLGRVLGVVSLVHRGAHATGLLLVSPLFAFVAARTVFGASAVALAATGLVALAAAAALERRRSLA